MTSEALNVGAYEEAAEMDYVALKEFEKLDIFINTSFA